MTVFTDYLVFNTKKKQEFVRITDDVAAIVKKSAVKEGMALVSAVGRWRRSFTVLWYSESVS